MKKLMNFRPFLFLSLSLILGLLISYFYTYKSKIVSIFLLIVFCVLIILFVVFGFINKSKLKSIVYSIVFIVILLTGIFSFSFTVSNYDNENSLGHSFDITAKITEIQDTNYGQKAVLSNVQLKGYKTSETKYKILAYIYGESLLDIGDYVNFSSSLKDLFSINDSEFSSSNIQRKIKYSLSINAEEIKIIDNSLSIFERINLFIRDSLNKGLNKDEFSLAYAMLTGNSEYMDSDLLAQYRAVGIAHIFAVSGLHIGFLAVALKFILDKLKVNKYLKTIIIILAVFFYSGICGFSASSIRASIMISVALIGSVVFKRYDPISAISISALIILLISPIELFCAGFQLSFSVVLGLILLSKKIEKILKFLPKKLASSLGAVLSAQLSSIPVSLCNFGNFSTISVLVNILFIPIVGVIFVALFVLTVLGGVFTISSITLFPLQYILFAVNWIINLLDYRFFLFSGISISGFAVCYYLTLLIISGIFNIQKIVKIISCIVLSITFIFGSVFVNINKYNSLIVSACGSENCSSTLIQEKGENCVVISSLKKNKTISSLTNMLSKNAVDKIDYLILPKCDDNYVIYSLIGLLNYYYSIERVIYYGNSDEITENAVKSTLKDIIIYSIDETKSIKIGESDISFISDGYGVKITKNDIKILIFSNVESHGQISNVDSEKCYMLICYNEQDYIFSIIESEKKISYLPYRSVLNCYTKGFLRFSI